jgi:hypothetical protein
MKYQIIADCPTTLPAAKGNTLQRLPFLSIKYWSDIGGPF